MAAHRAARCNEPGWPRVRVVEAWDATYFFSAECPPAFMEQHFGVSYYFLHLTMVLRLQSDLLLLT
jgi:hypothetical protein